MKIAVISDAHANLIALKTVVDHIDAWKPDYVIVNGDLVNRGPRPAECLDLVQQRAKSQNWLLIRGNHEDYVISNARPDSPRSGPSFEVHRTSYWTFKKLDSDVAPLINMPSQQSITDPKGNEVRFVHGSMAGNRDGIYPETRNNDLRRKIFPKGSTPTSKPLVVLCVAHTHRPLIRNFEGILIVNSGSVGLPFDGDHFLAYTQLTWRKNNWHAQIIRLDYDIEQAEREFYTSGYLENGGPLVKLVQIELRTSSSHLYNWAIKFQDRALAGKISMGESVRQYLEAISV